MAAHARRNPPHQSPAPKECQRRRIGDILLDGNFISPADLERALQEQRRTNELLGEILIRLRLVERDELHAALSVQNNLSSFEEALTAAFSTRRLLGELLVEAKRITPEQLETSLDEQRETGEKLGQVLMRKNLVTKSEIEALLALQERQESGAAPPACFRVGEVLVSSGIISRGQLEDALKKQRRSKKKIGEILVECGYAHLNQISRALNIQKKLMTAALVALLSCAAVSAPEAATVREHRSASAQVKVSAYVLPYVKMKTVKQASQLVISPEDVRRGYVEIRDGTVFHVKTNNGDGYLLNFQVAHGPFTGVTVQDGGRDIELSGAVSFVHMPCPANIASGETRALTYRFMLDEKAEPGSYSWPLMVSASTA